MKKYSRQREAILNVLHSTDTHPTAAWVYDKVREVIPNISLGTVYRNLAALKEDGEVLSVTVGDGFEHFDGDISLHGHLHCKVCGKVFDARLTSDPLGEAADKLGFKPDTSLLLASGVCAECNKENN